MKAAALRLCLCLLAAAGPLSAQTITLKAGNVVQGENFRVTGSSVFLTVKIGDSKGNVGYAIDSIAKVDIPKPPQLKAAADRLRAGQARQALEAINPVVLSQAPLRHIPGSWWAQAATLKLAALSILGMDDQVAPLIEEMLAFTANPEVVRAAKLQQAVMLARRGDYDRALQIARPLAAESRAAAVLAATWVCIGDSELGLKNYQAALLAYLHVPVFYPEERAWLPAALLGSARAYEGLEDFIRARSSIEELQKTFTSSPQAGASQADLKRIELKLNNKN
jgi:tetratricopeptide (TPR) repeat protein